MWESSAERYLDRLDDVQKCEVQQGQVLGSALGSQQSQTVLQTWDKLSGLKSCQVEKDMGVLMDNG